jgi:uncharacterized membrane protein
MHMMFVPFGIFAVVSWLLIIAGGVLLVVWLVRTYPTSIRPAPASGQLHEAPLDILARRFAAGEITAEEFQKARDLLRGDQDKK